VDGEIVNLSNEEENQQDYMSPIRLDISYPSGSIDTFQQLDYREIWTIGYNVKVKFIGGIHDQSLSQFTRDYEKNQELLMNSAMSHDEHTTFMPVEQNEEHIKTQAEINSTPVQPVAHSTLSVMSGAKEKFPKWAHDALQKVWPEQREHAFKFQIDYKVIWELPRFLSAYFPAKQDLRNVLTLTGDEKKAQAVSCGQYMSVNFPHSSLHLLEVIQNYLDGQENSKCCQKYV
jgi:hypothetical protein